MRRSSRTATARSISPPSIRPTINRRVSENDKDLLVSNTFYDAVGNVIGSTDGDGNLTTYDYDGLNRRITMTDPLDKMTRYSYDPVGNLLRVLDRNGNPTIYTYDADNRRITITDAQPATTTFAYDGVGNLLSITDANGHITGFGYDAVNRKIAEIYPDPSNNTVSWTYDMVGKVKTRTDQRSQVTNYSYSDLYFLQSRSYPSGTDSFTYDLSGRVLTGNTTRGFGWNETFQYDGSDRLTQSLQNGKAISYMYDIPGRTRMVTYPGGRMITEMWDYRPRLMSINDGGSSPIVQYAYDPANNVLTRGYRNGTVATSTYNANNWVCSLVHTSGPNLIVGFTYAYDNEGNKFYEQKLHEPGRSEAYTYDSVYRLVNYQVGTLSSSPPPDCPAGAVGVPTPVTQTAYNLDKLGNWNSKTTDGVPQTRTHSPSNEIATINGGPVVSDFNGNTTNYGPSGYQYDEENRLIKAVAGPLQTLRGQYQYDAFGRRVSKLDLLGNQTLYYYDGWRTIEEQSPAGVTQATYVFGNYLDEALTMDRGGHTYYYHQNTLGSTYALTDSSGDGVEGYYYDAYGMQTIVLPGPDGKLDFDSDDGYTPGAKSSVGNPFTFTGQRFDPETGLLYYKNRYNSTSFGRFTSRDPKDYGGGDPNLYPYVGNRPTNLVDPSGLGDESVERRRRFLEWGLSEQKRLQQALRDAESGAVPSPFPGKTKQEVVDLYKGLLKISELEIEKGKQELGGTSPGALRQFLADEKAAGEMDRTVVTRVRPGNCLRPQDPWDKYRAPYRLFGVAQGLERASGGGVVVLHFSPGIVEGLANCHRDPTATIYAGGCTFATCVGGSNLLYGAGTALTYGGFTGAGGLLTSGGATFGTAAAPATLCVLTAGASVYTGYELDRQSGGSTSTGAAILSCFTYDLAANVTYRWLPWTDARVNYDLTNTCRQR